MTVSILNYGLGNLGSVANMFRRIGTDFDLISTPEEVAASERVLLPGVGAFDNGMRRLADLGLIDSLSAFAATGKPLMGICLGMQLLLDSSEEGEAEGLKLIPGRSHRFANLQGRRVPHMGWNTIAPYKLDDPLFAGLGAESRFYFVHSYHVVPKSDRDVLATTEYGGGFVSMVRSGNVMGAQFHPEKSHVFGMTLLRNFSTL